MIAKGLRRALAIQVVGVLLLAYLLVWFAGVGGALAAALAFGALLLVYLGLVLLTYAICWPRGLDVEHLRFLSWGAWRAIFVEWFSFFALFAVIQPFADSIFSVKGDAKVRGEKLPVLLVHGYRCNSGLWWWFISGLRRANLQAEAIDLEPQYASIDIYAAQLHAVIEAYLRQSGSEKLRLVTHSMGGEVARAYLQRYGTGRVDQLITLAAVHHGTRLAKLGRGQNAREMEGGSRWLAGLAEPVPVPTVSIWSPQDNFIAPQTSARLTGARNIVLPGIGHLSFVFSTRVRDIVIEILKA